MAVRHRAAFSRLVNAGLGRALLAAGLLAGCAGPAELPSPTPQTGTPGAVSTAAGAIPPGFDVQGHRGARGLKPENTLPAFETALDLGVTTLELDLHFTADGVVVVWHDPAISSAKCGLDSAAQPPLPPDPDQPDTPEQDLMISRMSFADLQKYRCNRNPDAAEFPDQNSTPTALAGDDYGLVSLEQLLEFVDAYAASPAKSEVQRTQAQRVAFNVETKRRADQPETIDDGFNGQDPGPFERALIELVEARGLQARVVVQSFDQASVWAVRQLNPQVRVAVLTSGTADPQAYAEKGAAIWSPRARDLNARLLEEAHTAGLRVVPWTVNEPDDMHRLIELGVDGLITDRPDVLLVALASRAAERR